MKPGRPVAFAVPAVAAGLLAAGGTWVLADASTLGGGPARWDEHLPQNAVGGQPLIVPAHYGWAVPLPVGQEFTDGLMVVLNQADAPIRITEVDADFDEPGVEFLGAYIAGTDRSVAAAKLSEEFPPAAPELGPLQGAEGTELRAFRRVPRPGLRVLLGYRVTEPGTHYRGTVTLPYDYDGKEWTQTSGAELIVCAETAAPAQCGLDDGPSDP